MIELVGVSKKFGEIQALRDVSLTVRRGELLTVLGSNGSGKTTLLKILAALETPSEGVILLEGSRIDKANVSEIRRRITMVFQRTVVFRGSVHHNVAYGLRLRDFKGEEVHRRVEEALDLMGLRDLRHRNAKSLSGGEQKRLSLARALVLNCDLLLLDEPLVNLDPESLSIVTNMIRRLNEETDTAVVMATHNLGHAKELSERLVLLERGEVVEVGRAIDLLGAPSIEMSRFARSENTFSGDACLIEGFSHIDVGEGVMVRASFGSEGRVTIQIRPEDIILSKHKIESSARNTLRGRIVRMEDRGSVVRLKVDVGRVFTVQITRKSLVEMGLNIGQDIYLTFKASSVQLI